MSETTLTKDIGTRANFSFKQLGQIRPADTNAASLYSPPSNALYTEVTRIIICNQGGITPKFRIFHDDDGTTYDETTALYWDEVTVADTTQLINIDIHMNNASGNLAVRTDTANDLTFTAYGVEVTK